MLFSVPTRRMTLWPAATPAGALAPSHPTDHLNRGPRQQETQPHSVAGTAVIWANHSQHGSMTYFRYKTCGCPGWLFGIFVFGFLSFTPQGVGSSNSGFMSYHFSFSTWLEVIAQLYSEFWCLGWLLGTWSAIKNTRATRVPIYFPLQGILTSETRCLNCETVTSKDEDFFDLSIDVEQNTSITSCLKNFSNTETLCSGTKQRRSNRTVQPVQFCHW